MLTALHYLHDGTVKGRVLIRVVCVIQKSPLHSSRLFFTRLARHFSHVVAAVRSWCNQCLPNIHRIVLEGCRLRPGGRAAPIGWSVSTASRRLASGPSGSVLLALDVLLDDSGAPPHESTQ